MMHAATPWVLALAGLLVALPASAAGVSLQDRPQLIELLREAPPCCVIDARAEKARREKPIAHALAYRQGMSINPSGPVVVIGSSDQQALAVGNTLADRSGAAAVYAVKGGYATWQAVELNRLKSTLPSTFVIPSDTCQQGPALQQLPFDRQ
ncbi:MAG: rhodanese-like domain-containing protein [Betaproteobacteria bacterium]|nr:rhodanese-like domain-containing protein [Betaproteobacteria bacterium]